MFSLLLAMAGFSLVGAITPGPVNVLALRHGSQARRRVALGFVLGASASYAAVVWCMGQGAQWLVDGLPGLAPLAQRRTRPGHGSTTVQSRTERQSVWRASCAAGSARTRNGLSS